MVVENLIPEKNEVVSQQGGLFTYQPFNFTVVFLFVRSCCTYVVDKQRPRTGRFLIHLSHLLVFFLAACSPKDSKSSSKSNEAPPRKVVVGRVEIVPLEQTITALGSLVPIDQATLSAKVPGRIRKFVVDVGSTVQSGDLLAELEREDYVLKLRQAEALLAQARARLGLDPKGESEEVVPEKTSLVKQAGALLEESTKNKGRLTNLSKDGIISQAEVEVAVAGHEVALNKYQDALEEVRNRIALLSQRKAEYLIAEQELKDTRILAPFAGMIQDRKANLGEYLQEASPILSLVRMNPLRVRAEVSEREAFLLKPGLLMRLHTSGVSNHYTATISRISPALDLQTRMLTLEADVANTGELRPGYFVNLEIVTSTNLPAMVVPKEALVVFAGIEKIFVVEHGVAVERRVTSGRKSGNWIEVSGPIKTGNVVVLSPGNLSSGQRVEPNTDS
jgi:RND family efflux transporter MFP subunit